MGHNQNNGLPTAPVVSVIIPVFRAEKYLARCMDSLLRQSFQQFEIILIDDGSDDNSSTLCDQYQEEDYRVIVIHQANQGTAAARNAGLDAAKGQYIAFIDPDDWVHADYLQVLVQQIGDSMVCSCGHLVVREYVEDETQGETDKISCNGLQALGREDCRIYIWGKLYRRSDITTMRFDTQLKYSEDRVFNAALFVNHPEDNCVIIQNPLYYYYQHDSAITKNIAFTDLPAVGKMIAIAEETKCDALLHYLITWLCGKRRSGYHIGNPPDFSTVEAYLEYCEQLLTTQKVKYSMMIHRPKAYGWMNRIRRVPAKVLRILRSLAEQT